MISFRKSRSYAQTDSYGYLRAVQELLSFNIQVKNLDLDFARRCIPFLVGKEPTKIR